MSFSVNTISQLDEVPRTITSVSMSLQSASYLPLLYPQYMCWGMDKLISGYFTYPSLTARPTWPGGVVVTMARVLQAQHARTPQNVISRWLEDNSAEVREIIAAERTVRVSLDHPDLETLKSDHLYWRDNVPDGIYKSAWRMEDDILHRPITAEEKTRTRFNPKVPDFWSRFYGPRYSRGLYLYFSVVPRDGKPLLQFLLKEWFPFTFPTGILRESTLRAIFKLLSGWTKRNCDAVPGWRAMVGLLDLGGYTAAPPTEDFLDAAKEWVSDPLEPPGSKLPNWHAYFLEGVDQFVEGVQPAPPTVGFYEFIAGQSWTRGGSAGVSLDVSIQVDGWEKPIPVRSTKDLLPLKYTTQQIYDIALDPTPKTAKAFVKRQPDKSRLVILTDLGLYLNMAWLSTALEPAMRKIRGTTLFYSGARFSSLWEEMARDSCDPSMWHVPIDQSKFDHNITLDMIDAVLTVISRLLPDHEQQQALARIRTSIVVAPAGVVVGDTTIPVRKGILSGWRWTALLDTWIQFAELYASWTWLHHFAGAPAFSYEGLCTQGDDARVVVEQPALAIGVCEVMRMAGLKITPEKTWVSPSYDEYLRQVSGRTGVFGYLSRGITSILWRNPIKSEPVCKITEIRAVAQRWQTLVNRDAPLKLVAHFAKQELRRFATQLAQPFEVIANWVATPVVVGGVGLHEIVGYPTEYAGPYLVPAVTILPSKSKFPGLPGLQEIQSKAARYGLHWMDLRPMIHDEVVRRMKPFMPGVLYPKTRVVTEWVIVTMPAVKVSVPIRDTRWKIPLSSASSDPLVPRWFHQTCVKGLISQGRYDDVDALLPSSHSIYSAWIRATHRIRTWADWLLGTLSLPLRPRMGWGSNYLSGKLSGNSRRIISAALASTKPYCGARRFAIEIAYYNTQPHPSSWTAIRIGS